MPLPFLPNAKPRNLKFLIANTLTVRLFSRLTVNFSFPPRYFVLLSKSLFDARLLFARSTMSSAYRMHGTPVLFPFTFYGRWSIAEVRPHRFSLTPVLKSYRSALSGCMPVHIHSMPERPALHAYPAFYSHPPLHGS